MLKYHRPGRFFHVSESQVRVEEDRLAGWAAGEREQYIIAVTKGVT